VIHKQLLITFFLSFLLVGSFASSQNGNSVHLSSEDNVFINEFTHVYHTPDTLSGIAAWSKISNHQMAQTDQKTNPGMSFATDAYWVVFKLSNTQETSETYYLEIDYAQLDKVNVFEIAGDSVITLYKTGDSQPFKNRSLNTWNFVFPLKMEAHQQMHLLINLDKRLSTTRFPMTVYPEALYFKKHFRENLINGVYFGFTILVILASLLLGSVLHQRVFIAYSVYVLAFALWLFSRLGYTYQFILSDYPEINRHFFPIMTQGALMGMIWYIQNFFNTREHLPGFNKLMNGIQYFFVAALFFWVSFPEIMVDTALYLFPLKYAIASLIIIFAISAAVRYWSVDAFRSKMFLAAYIGFFLAIFGKIVTEYGALNESNWQYDPVIIGFIFEVTILSVAMAIVLKRFLEEKTTLTKELENQSKQQITLKSKAVLALEEIMFIRSDGHYLEFYTSEKSKPEIDRNKLKEVMDQLPDSFKQIHRSHIVNTDYIKYANKIQLTNGEELPVSGTYKDSLEDLIQL